MKTSTKDKVLNFYDISAESYSKMMDVEIDQPLYSDTLSRLAERITHVSGSILDTSCGSGHMLSKYHEQYDSNRLLIGIDLSPNMADVARKRLGQVAKILVGDMRELEAIESNSIAAVLCYFSLHHIDPDDALPVFHSWNRILRTGGQILVATWEGNGPVDYGNASDVVALRHSKEEVVSWTQQAGFVVNRCVVEWVEDIAMNAIYLEGTKQ